MVSFLKKMLPLLAAFLVGSVFVVFASADPPPCDWSKSGSTFVTFVGPGAATPEEALQHLEANANITIPEAALTRETGDDRYVETAIDKQSGAVSYAIYVDGVHRIQATVERLPDGTYYPTGFDTCYGV